jgi:hypothetical protein
VKSELRCRIMIRGDRARLFARSDDFGTTTTTLHLVTSAAPNAQINSVGLDGFQGKSPTVNPELQNATQRVLHDTSHPVIYLQLQRPQTLRAPLFLPSLGPQRPVYVSSLGTPYAERTHVAQVQLRPLTQGSSIFLKSPYISICNFVGCTL